MSIVVLAIVLSAWAFGLRRWGVFSLQSALLLGMTAYSVPVLFGTYIRPGLHGGLYGADVSQGAGLVMAWAWLCVLLSLLFYSRKKIPAPEYIALPSHAQRDSRAGIFCLACLASSLCLYFWISIVDSPFFFMGERQVGDVLAERQKLLWKWVNLYGLIVAISIRSRLLTLVFVSFLGLHFLAGDRTMVLISGAAVVVYFFERERGVTALLRVDVLVMILLVSLLLIFGKPVYYSIKSQTINSFELVLNPRYKLIFLSFYEPLVSHTILEDVMRRDFTYAWSDFIKGVGGQLLVIPSAFGIDSSAFNVELQRLLYPRVQYGVANHYFAQGWSLGAWFGVALFAFILVSLIHLLAYCSSRVSPLPRVLVIIMGVIMGTYFFRNSFENILSMLRQVFLVGAFLLMATQVTSYFRRRPEPFRSRPLAQK